MSEQPVIALVSTIAWLGLAVAAGWAVRQRGACQWERFLLFFSFCSPCLPPCYLVVGAASAQAQKRVRLSDVGHTEHEGLPVPVSAPVPGPAAGVSHSAAVVAPLVGNSSPSLDGSESKLDDPSAAAVLDGGAVASAADGMEDVVVLEPEAAAGVAAAHNTWTRAQALGVVTVAREQLIRTLSRRGGLPPEDASCVVFHDGAPFYKCGVCKVRVPLASGRGALVEHYLSSKHLRSCSLRAAVTQRPGMRVQGGGSWPKVGPSTGAPTPQALGAPAALSSAPGVPPAVVSVTASAGADATQVGSGGSGPGGSSAGDSAAPGPAPAGNVEAGVAAFALKQSFFLRDLSITDVNEQRWWRWHAEDCVECTMCNKRIFGGGQYRSSLAARVREHRGTAEHSQQYQSRKGQSVLSFRAVPSPVVTEAERVSQAVDRLLLNTRLWCRGFSKESVVYRDKHGDVQFTGSPMAIFDVVAEYPVEGMHALKRYGVIDTPHYRSEGCFRNPWHLPTIQQVRDGVQSLVCEECAGIPFIPAFKKRLNRAAVAADEGRAVNSRDRSQVGGYPTASEKASFIKDMAAVIGRLQDKVWYSRPTVRVWATDVLQLT